MKFTEAQLEVYRKAARQHEAERRAALNVRRERAWALARQAAQMGKSWGRADRAGRTHTRVTDQEGVRLPQD